VPCQNQLSGEGMPGKSIRWQHLYTSNLVLYVGCGGGATVCRSPRSSKACQDHRQPSVAVEDKVQLLERSMSYEHFRQARAGRFPHCVAIDCVGAVAYLEVALRAQPVQMLQHLSAPMDQPR
jgi:hypothetical protein